MEKNKIPPPNDRRKRTERENLCCYCNTQHDSVKSSRNQTRQGADVVYKPQWQFYDSLAFLEDMVAPRHTLSNMETLSELTSVSLPRGDLPAHKKKLSKEKALSSAIKELMMAAISKDMSCLVIPQLKPFMKKLKVTLFMR